MKGKSRIKNIWNQIRHRCYNPNFKDYTNYGARGIERCKEWEDFETFYNWSIENGYQDTLSIDRIDNNGPYAPWNCRWATPTQQANNRRSSYYVTYNGETKTIAEWADFTGLPFHALWRRLAVYNWTPERALTEPCGKKHYIEYNGLTMQPHEWAKYLDMDYDMLERRINALGWDVERAFTEKSGRLITYNGVTKRLCEWAKELGVKRNVIEDRIDRCGWSVERAFFGDGDIMYEYNGKKDTLPGWAKTLGIKYQTLYWRICHKNWDIQRAFTTPSRVSA